MKRLFCFLMVCILLLCHNSNLVYAAESNSFFSLSDAYLLTIHQNSVRFSSLDYHTEAEYIADYVYTPNNTAVLAKHYLEDFDQSYINYFESIYSMYEPYCLAEYLDYPTTRYNCHSYAWYSQNTAYNSYWIPYPDNYYLDDSYFEVNVPRSGDIICYFDNKGTASLSDDENIHSGIVETYDPSIVSNNICGNANQVTVISKWGSGGLFRHRGDICVYTSNYNGNADYVKFYRPRTDSTHQLAEDMSAFALSETLTHTGEITDRYVMYEFDVEDKIPYLITVTSNISTNDRFYDSSMNYQNVSGFDMGNGKYGYIYTFDIGINYFRIENVNSSAEANLVVHVYAHNGHNFCNVLSLGDTYHTYSCPCGETSGTQELHRWRDYSLTHVVCEDCGLLKRLPPEGFTPIIKGITPDTETE